MDVQAQTLPGRAIHSMCRFLMAKRRSLAVGGGVGSWFGLIVLVYADWLVSKKERNFSSHFRSRKKDMEGGRGGGG